VTKAYDWAIRNESGLLVLEPADLVRATVTDYLAGTSRSSVAARFHNSVARAIVETCRRLGREAGLDRVCLSGGVFQNAFLLARTIDGLESAGLRVYTQRLVPPNDGGIALGQAAIATARLAAGTL
jgi:hydrogenase maturation protein HypF